MKKIIPKKHQDSFTALDVIVGVNMHYILRKSFGTASVAEVKGIPS